MTNQQQQPSAAVMSAAAEWYWRIREPDVSEAELREWQEWLSGSTAHQCAFDRIEHALDGVADMEAPPWPTENELVGDRYDGSVSVANWLKTEGDRRAASTPPSHGSARYFAIAASVLVAVALGVILLTDIGRDPRVPDVVAYATLPAEHKDVMLPDGSSIALGGMTQVSVAYSPASRKIDLKSGEAYFDVASDPDRPFEVHAGGRRIVALGTSFNVTRQAARVTLTVTEGQVIVETEDDSPSAAQDAPGTGTVDARVAQLDAGQRIVFDEVGIEPISFADAGDTLAWRSGVLKYRGEKLRYVIEDVNRYTRTPITVEDDRAGDLLFTGTVFQDSAESWVYGLEDAFPVSVEQTGSGVTIHSTIHSTDTN